jgi:TPR repeat protein
MRATGFWALAVGLAVAAGIATPAVALPKVVPLGAASALSDDPLGRCGALAAAPFERGEPGGLSDDQVLLDEALAACEAAHAADPDSSAAATWLGRVYVLVGRAPEAVPLLEDAAGRGNAVALYLLSGLLSNQVDDGVEDDFDRAVQLLRQAADIGYAPAALELGRQFETGEAADLAEAQRLYELASGQGLGMATYELALRAHAGSFGEPDYARAMTLYRQAAAQGEPAGSYGIGQLYQYGEGVEIDYVQAAAAYQAGADAGEMMSQTALGYLYDQGLGVPQDVDVAFTLLRAAADQNYGYAEAALALHYLYGEGTPVDVDKAYALAWQAVQKDIVYANGIVGFMYAEGLGTDRDLSAALAQFQAGADGGDQYSADRIAETEAEIACQDAAGSPYELRGSGHGVAYEAIDADAAIAACEAALAANPGSVGDGVWLARAYMKAGRFADAAPLLAAGVAADNVLALTISAGMLLAGGDVEPDPAQAIALYGRAADKGFAPAAFALGQLYAVGDVVTRDPDRASGYFKQAQDAGMEDAAPEASERGMPDGPAEADLQTGFGEEGPAY